MLGLEELRRRELAAEVQPLGVRVVSQGRHNVGPSQSATRAPSICSSKGPVSNARARPTAWLGTSTTRSPSASSRCANGRPATLLPSTAHVRSGYPATCRRIAAHPGLVRGDPAGRDHGLLVVDDLDGRRQLVGIDPDEHSRHHLPCLPPPLPSARRAGTAAESGADPSGATHRHGDRRERKPKMSHTRSRMGSRKESLRRTAGPSLARHRPYRQPSSSRMAGRHRDRYVNEAPPAVAATADFVYTAVLKPSVGPRCHVVSAREAP